MRVKKLENIEQLSNIKDDECFVLNLDYEIIDHWKWLYNEDGSFDKCIHPYTIIKIHSQDLLDKLNSELELRFALNEDIKVTYDLGMDIQRFLMNNGKDWKLTGSISDKKIED